MKNLFSIFIFSSVLFAPLAHAQTVHTGIAKITEYHTGWNQPMVRVKIEGGVYNEFPSCNTNMMDGYILAADITGQDTGYETHTSALLAAYMAGKRVQLALSSCVIGRPKIVGVSIFP